VLDEDAVALPQALPLDERRAGRNDHADVLVAHDHRRLDHRVRVHLHVGAADARDLHLQQRPVVRDPRQRELPQLGSPRAGSHRRQHALSH